MDGDVMTLAEWLAAIGCNAFTDDDGSGYLVFNGERSRFRAVPSRMVGRPESDFWPFTHVVWFNK